MEVIRFSLPFSIVRGLWSAIYLTSLLAALITGMLAIFGLIILVAKLLGGRTAIEVAGDLGRMPLALCEFFGFAWLFVSVVGFPMSLIPAIFSRWRRIWADAENVYHETRYGRESRPLDEVSWRRVNMGWENYGVSLPNSPVVQLNADREKWLCGFSEQSREWWEIFLTTANVHRVTTLRITQILKVGVASVVVGGLLGSLTGLIAKAVTGNPKFLPLYSVVGVFDGVAAAAGYCVLLNEGQDRYAKRFGPFAMPALFAVVGARVARGSGMTVLISCAIVSALAGGVLGFLWCRKRT